MLRILGMSQQTRTQTVRTVYMRCSGPGSWEWTGYLDGERVSGLPYMDLASARAWFKAESRGQESPIRDVIRLRYDYAEVTIDASREREREGLK